MAGSNLVRLVDIEASECAMGELPDIVAHALLSEARAIEDFANCTSDVVAAIDVIHQNNGPLVVAGIGKSGHIGGKISSTFRSLGKPSVFLHPAEASHGDLGLVHAESAVLVLSNSGETAELSDLLHFCRIHKNPVIALTSRDDSTLAKAADTVIAYGKVAEVCRNGLAPTTSTTLSLAIGDALAVGLSHVMKTEPEDFRRYHPGGKLGANLRTVEDAMRTGQDLPLVAANAPMSETVVMMSEKSMGVALIVEAGVVSGIVTDGDLRRHADNLWDHTAEEIATRDPVRITPDWLLSDAAELMSVRGISVAVVETHEGKLAGLLHIHDTI